MEYRKKINEIKGKYLRGEINIEQAEKLVEPLLKKMNEKGEEIALMHGFKYKKLTFNYIFR